jgi:hypothetical protein
VFPRANATAPAYSVSPELSKPRSADSRSPCISASMARQDVASTNGSVVS